MSNLTDERGKNYGHPADQFVCAEAMFEEWATRRNAVTEPIMESNDGLNQSLEYQLQHAVHMICTKLSRAAANPLHLDNWDDIQGYAECFKMCAERSGE